MKRIAAACLLLVAALALLGAAALSEEEQMIYKRGRNSKPATMAKNASAREYKTATGMEALLGYLYLTDQHTRLIDIVKRSLEIWEENHRTA